MNIEKLSFLMNKYVDTFEDCNGPAHEEYYKWDAVSCFQAMWDVDAINFPEMFSAATKELSVLIDGSHQYSTSGIDELLKHGEIEFVRQSFRDLFQEDGGDLRTRMNRVRDFIDAINSHLHSYFKNPKMYEQQLRSAIGYLALWKPGENYFYKPTEANYWCAATEYDGYFGAASDFDLHEYYRMCDQTLEAIKSNQILLHKHAARFRTHARGFDDKLHIVVYDIMFCARAYKYYDPFPPESISTIRLKAMIQDTRTEKENLYDRLKEINKFLKTSTPDLIGATIADKQGHTGTVSDVKVLTISNKRNITVYVKSKSKIGPYAFPYSFKNGFVSFTDDHGSGVWAEWQNAEKERESISSEISSLDKTLTTLESQLNKLMTK